ncbi:MAG: hypothetical protein ACLFNU_03690 [Bacteroidales bacterium]
MIEKSRLRGKGFFAILVLALLFSSCSRYNYIIVEGIQDVQLRGIKQKVIYLNVDIEIDNPNTRRITVLDINFTAWLNNRELGEFRLAERIKLTPCSKQVYTVPVEIELRTVADAFRLASSGSIERLLKQIEVEGIIKGRSFPVRKRIRIKRQPFIDIAASV